MIFVRIFVCEGKMIEIKDYPELSRVIEIFEEISRIPRESGNRGPIADYLCGFARERGLEYHRDAADNVLIRCEATEGYESAPAVILQGHTDMVLATDSRCTHDPRSEGVRLVRDGDLLRAVGTTLGGDDGIAIAYALALIDGGAERHPTLEALFTSDEEIGLLGAGALEVSDFIKGRRLINIDSDVEGVFIAGCAGGLRADLRLPLEYESADGDPYKLRLFGLLGGHSGAEIDKGRENGIKLLADALTEISALFDCRIASICGGSADNAIPAFAEARIFVDRAKREQLLGICSRLEEKYKRCEAGAALALLPDAAEERSALTRDSQTRLLSLLNEARTGVDKMSEEIPGLVESSENLGIIESDGEGVRITFSVRSSKSKEKLRLKEALSALAEKYGAEFSTHGEYPAWEFKPDSALRTLMCRTYRDMYGKDAEVVAIHAGLECGILSEKIPGLDSVSLGPDNFDIHTPEERLSLSSTKRVYEFLIKLLKDMKGN